MSANAYLSLDQLNQMIENFDYGYSDSCNKPSPISHTTLADFTRDQWSGSKW